MRCLSSVSGVLLLLLLGACESQDQSGQGSGKVSSKEVQEKTAAAVKALSDFAQQKNQEFRRQMEGQLKELDQKIRELNRQVAELGAEASDDLKDMVERMSKQSEAARKKLGELASATGESVESMQQDIEEKVSELKKSYEKAESSNP